jgi:hypothetical protein
VLERNGQISTLRAQSLQRPDRRRENGVREKAKIGLKGRSSAET